MLTYKYRPFEAYYSRASILIDQLIINDTITQISLSFETSVLKSSRIYFRLNKSYISKAAEIFTCCIILGDCRISFDNQDELPNIATFSVHAQMFPDNFIM